MIADGAGLGIFVAFSADRVNAVPTTISTLVPERLVFRLGDRYDYGAFALPVKDVPKLGPGWGYHYEKFHRTAQAWAIVGVAAAVRRSDGTIREARIALTNMGPTPLRAGATEDALRDHDLDDHLRQACESADAETSPPADLHAQPDYRRHLARVLTYRAVLGASL